MRPGVEAFLAERTIAVVGVSRTRGIGNAVLHSLMERGYRVYPVNSQTDAVEGQQCYRSLTELPEGVGGVVIAVPPEQTVKIVDDCLRCGIKHIWMQPGSQSEEAIRLAESDKISVVRGACILMYAEPDSIHRLHRWINQILGRL